MPERVAKHWNVSSPVNALFVAFLVFLCGSAIFISLIDLFGLPMVIGGSDAQDIPALPATAGFSARLAAAGAAVPPDSPFETDVGIRMPPLSAESSLQAVAIARGNVIARTDCLDELPEGADGEPIPAAGLTNLTCPLAIPYEYLPAEQVAVYAVLEEDGNEYGAPAGTLAIDWSAYEPSFWGSAAVITVVAALGALACGAIALAMLFFTRRASHDVEYAGEYGGWNMLAPLAKAHGISQLLQAYIASPLFWALESFGILVMLGYLALASEPWQSASALYAFGLSGVLSFITPFLWVAVVWFAEYKEREPLRVIVSLFLWGGFACLMAIGLNSLGSDFLGILGLGFLASSVTAPIFEELFKGTGLAIFSLHHEFDGMVDGIVYGFVIGMGFSFVEDWLYLLQNPMGADVGGWLVVFILRSLFFSANHGVFTAFAGGTIGFLKERGFPYASLGIIVGILPGIILHAVHNSAEIWTALFGGPGICLYLCILPLFDYGGLLLLAVLMVAGVAFMHGRERRQDTKA